MTVHSPLSTAEALGELKGLLGDRLLLDEEDRSLFRSDFGRQVNRLQLQLVGTGELQVLQGGQQGLGAGATVVDHGVATLRRVARAELPQALLGLAVRDAGASLDAVGFGRIVACAAELHG